MGIIYCYTNIITGKKYIGQTIHPEQRKANHKHESYNGSDYYFHRSIRKYGFENFIYEILEETDNLTNRETFYIKEMNTLWPNGYNQILEQHMQTEETRKKISQSQKIRLANRTSEQIETENKKRSISLTGRKQPESQKLKVAEKLSSKWQITHPNGKIETIFNLRKFCKDYNLGNTGQSNLTRGSYKGYKAIKLS